jgi:hypothetical protein
MATIVEDIDSMIDLTTRIHEADFPIAIRIAALEASAALTNLGIKIKSAMIGEE